MLRSVRGTYCHSGRSRTCCSVREDARIVCMVDVSLLCEERPDELEIDLERLQKDFRWIALSSTSFQLTRLAGAVVFVETFTTQSQRLLLHQNNQHANVSKMCGRYALGIVSIAASKRREKLLTDIACLVRSLSASTAEHASRQCA